MNSLPKATASASPAASAACRGFLGELFIRDIHAAERRLQLRAEAVAPSDSRAQMKRDLALAEFARHIAEGRRQVAVAHVVRVAARREVHADAAWRPTPRHGVGHFEHQTRAVFDRAAVVRRCACWCRPAGTGRADSRWRRAFRRRRSPAAFAFSRALADTPRRRPGFRRVRARAATIRPLRTHQAHMALGRDRARRDRQLAVKEDRVRDTADMPQLQEDLAAGLVHGVGDELPAFDLLLRPDARRVGITHALRRDRSRFAR